MKHFLNQWEVYLLSGIILLSAFVYRDSFNARFFQDDRIAMDMAGSGNWLATVPDVYHYRPVSIQLFYGLSRNLFGLNPIGYHLAEFAAYSLTVVVVYLLLKKILKSREKAMTGTFVYALNVSLFGNFFWIATSYFSLGALFYFLAAYLYLKPGIAATVATFLVTILAIFSNELALTLPFIFLVLSWHFGSWSKRLVGSFVLAGFYFVAKLKIIGLPRVSDYSYSLSGRVLVTARWYLFRGLNLPEGVRFEAGNVILWLFLVLIFLMTIGLMRYFSLRQPHARILLLSGVWFIVAAAPFYFLPNHMSSYYLTMALFGPALFVGEIVSESWLRATVLPVYLWLTIVGLEFLSRTHWIILKNTGPIGKF
ncbi:hypothetical protein M1403_01175 [Patescibacteria group bacterium]|nr:hypothetical protein [Patescibacteria group bacterium]